MAVKKFENMTPAEQVAFIQEKMAANPALAASVAPAIRSANRATRTDPGPHIVPVSEKDRSYNCTGKMTYVAVFENAKASYTVCIDAAIVRTDAGDGYRISTGYGGIYGVKGSTATSGDEVKVYNRLLAQHTDEIVDSLLAQHTANIPATPYRTKEDRKATS